MNRSAGAPPTGTTDFSMFDRCNLAQRMTHFDNGAIGRRAMLGLTAAFLLSSLGCGPDVPDPDKLYRQGRATEEGGTGRFYMGREIARVRSHEEVAGWLDRPDRETAEFPGRLVRAMELKPADVVADIGAGTGYYTFRLADEVPHGRVFAVDIQREMLNDIESRAEAEGYRNVQAVVGTTKDPNLPENAINVALIVGSYHEFFYPFEMMTNIYRSLVPGGRLFLVEYRGEDETLPASALHRLTVQQARKEMEIVGLKWVDTRSILPQQHLLIFRKPLPEAADSL